MMRNLTITCGLMVALSIVAAPAQAQFAGHNFKGDYGLRSGSQPDPGFYLAPMYIRYSGDTLRNRDGDSVGIDPERRGGLAANGYAAGLFYVSDRKILGANYGAMIFGSLTNNTLEVPILDLQQPSDTGFADLYLQPLNLGWHTRRADFLAGVGLFAPTGRYEFRGSDNVGLGMWSFELFAGTTLFFDEAKSWHLATTAFYETHTKKKDTEITVGDILTLEGGFGKSFMKGALSVGIAYYAQWKVTEDDLGLDIDLPGGRLLSKNKVLGVGPEVTIPIATKSKLIALVNARYFWESGARNTLEGTTLVVTVSFPIPSVPVN